MDNYFGHYDGGDPYTSVEAETHAEAYKKMDCIGCHFSQYEEGCRPSRDLIPYEGI